MKEAILFGTLKYIDAKNYYLCIDRSTGQLYYR